MCREMVRTSLGLLGGEIERRRQAPNDGKQYFVMHAALAEIAEQRLTHQE
jgi:hypothetical protein